MERVERKAFCFSINGEFITQLAKERFFMEGADYENVMELLLSCMCGTEMSDQELKETRGRCAVRKGGICRRYSRWILLY